MTWDQSRPISFTRSHRVKVRTRITLIAVWLVLFIPSLVVCDHLAVNGGGPLLALMVATMAWLVAFPVILITFRKHFRDYGQDDYPAIERPVEAPTSPPPYANRDNQSWRLERI